MGVYPEPAQGKKPQPKNYGTRSNHKRRSSPVQNRTPRRHQKPVSNQNHRTKTLAALIRSPRSPKMFSRHSTKPSRQWYTPVFPRRRNPLLQLPRHRKTPQSKSLIKRPRKRRR